MKQVIVVEDINESYYEGDMVEGTRCERLIATSAPVLPVLPDLLLRSAFSGYARRQWGQGAEFSESMPRRGCPLAMFVSPEHTDIHWMAKIVRTGEELPSGVLRLSADTSQRGVITGGLISDTATHDIARLFAGQAQNEAIYIRGMSQLSARLEGYFGFGLYGTLKGARVRWLAVTQT